MSSARNSTHCERTSSINSTTCTRHLCLRQRSMRPRRLAANDMSSSISPGRMYSDDVRNSRPTSPPSRSPDVDRRTELPPGELSLQGEGSNDARHSPERDTSGDMPSLDATSSSVGEPETVVISSNALSGHTADAAGITPLGPRDPPPLLLAPASAKAVFDPGSRLLSLRSAARR